MLNSSEILLKISYFVPLLLGSALKAEEIISLFEHGFFKKLYSFIDNNSFYYL